MFTLYGKNKIQRYDAQLKGPILFSQANPFSFFLYNLTKDCPLNIDKFKSFSIYVLSIEEGASVQVQKCNQKVSSGTFLQFDNERTSVDSKNGNSKILVVGISRAKRPQGIHFLSQNQIERIGRPWGYELLFTNGNPYYSFKKIIIRPGEKTELQFHRKTQETIVLLNGNVRLHYKNSELIPNERIQTSDISIADIDSVASIETKANTLHRFEALSEVTMFSASTPFSDDTIRTIEEPPRIKIEPQLESMM